VLLRIILAMVTVMGIVSSLLMETTLNLLFLCKIDLNSKGINSNNINRATSSFLGGPMSTQEQVLEQAEECQGHQLQIIAPQLSSIRQFLQREQEEELVAVAVE
jgi:hypothetical protein